MKHKWLIFFSFLLSIVLLLSILPFWNFQSLKAFNSTAQAHTANHLPLDKEEPRKTVTTPDKTSKEAEQEVASKTTSPKANQDELLPDDAKNSAYFEEENNKENETIPEQTTVDSNELKDYEQDAANAKKVYLTFDDGPSPTTDILLNILKEYEIKATFFMLEPRMTLFPESVIRLANEGHGLGLHGVTHDKKLFYQTPETAIAEMKLAQSTLTNLTGITTELVRTPYGSKPHMTDAHTEIMTKAGFIMWDWNVDSKDWYYRDGRLVEYTINQIKMLEEKNIQPVILLHDSKYTVNHLSYLLTYLLENQYEFGIIDSAMEPVVFH